MCLTKNFVNGNLVNRSVGEGQLTDLKSGGVTTHNYSSNGLLKNMTLTNTATHREKPRKFHANQ